MKKTTFSRKSATMVLFSMALLLVFASAVFASTANTVTPTVGEVEVESFDAGGVIVTSFEVEGMNTQIHGDFTPIATPHRDGEVQEPSGWTIRSEDGEYMSGITAMGGSFELADFRAIYGAGQRQYVSLETAIRAAFPLNNYAIVDVANLDYNDFARLPDIRNLILEARYGIVFGADTAWTVGGQMSILHENGDVELLPEFNELFPNWDLAQIENFVATPFDVNVETHYANDVVARFTQFFRASGTIHRQQADVNAPVFTQFVNNTGRLIHVDVILQQMNWPVGGVNIGITNMQTGESVGWRGGLVPGQGITLNNTPVNAVRGVRASTIDNSGFVVIDGFWR
jgi:hypothetical protein